MKQLLFMLMLLITINAFAQDKLSINGRVTGENQKPLEGATIFIGGTQFATRTNAEGKFEIAIPNAGSYHLLVKMLGYEAISKDVMLTDKAVDLDFSLTVKPIVLNQVNIGSDKNWAKNYELFKKDFLGSDANAKGCEIKNPEVINFSTHNGILNAESDEFLIIENNKLGYRIKYLLKTFKDDNQRFVSYNGDAVFEELPGTDLQKQDWTKNRLDVYKGSMMHFFRAVFTNTVLQEGFVAKQMYQTTDKRYYDAKPVKFDTLVTAIDTSFISIKFTGLYISYDPAKAANFLKPDVAVVQNPLLPIIGSQLIQYLKQPIVVDARGCVFSGYLLSFLIRGEWTNKRLGDQLPFEYQPPISTAISP